VRAATIFLSIAYEQVLSQPPVLWTGKS